MLRSIFDYFMRVTKVMAAACFAAMILLTLVQVANRYVLNLPIFWTEELIILMLVWSMFLGMPVQLWSHEEIVVDVIELKNPTYINAQYYLSLICSVAFCAVLAWTGWAFAQRGIPVQSPALDWSRFWFFVPIPISAGLSVIALLLRKRARSVGGFD